MKKIILTLLIVINITSIAPLAAQAKIDTRFQHRVQVLNTDSRTMPEKAPADETITPELKLEEGRTIEIAAFDSSSETTTARK